MDRKGNRGREGIRPNAFHEPTNAFGAPSSVNTTSIQNNSSGNSKSNRKIKQGKIEVDFEESCLLVNFDVEIVDMDDTGRVIEVLESIPELRRIKIKALTPDKNLAQMSEDIIDKCKYIHPSRMEEIEQLLIQLRRYQQSNEKKDSEDRSIPFRSSASNANTNVNMNTNPSKISYGYGSNNNNNNDSNNQGMDNDIQERVSDRPNRKRFGENEDPPLPPSKMDELDDYLEMLYQVSSKSEKEREDGLKHQIRGTAMILQLCRQVPNLEVLIQNNTVMGALTRVLQDEYKKSDELVFNILRIFLAFSNFVEMHSIMTNYKIGALTMKVIEFELKRIELREEERKQLDAKHEEELTKLRKSSNGSAESQSLIQEYIEKMKKNKAKELNNSKQIQLKQDKVLFVCYYILINLAEDANVEKKMIKKDLIVYLLTSLDLSYSDLLVLVMSFIKKLSVFEENKEILKDLNIIPKCMKFLSCSSPTLVNATLRLLFNLSFDQDVREELLKAGIVPKLVTLLKTANYRGRTLKLLYHLSVDDRCKSMITYTEAIPMLMGMVVNFPQPLLTKELAAVIVNLSHNPKNVEQMIANRGLNYLMDRLDNTKDPLLLKIIRNISTWTYNQQKDLENPEIQYRLRGLWSPFIKIFLKLANERESHEILVEVFGCLANMTSHDLPNTLSWSKILKEYNMLSIISKLLVPGMAQNDLMLEIILLLGTITSDSQACDMISTSSVIGLMYQVWKDRSDDVEIQLQLLNCFYRLILHEQSRDEVLYSTRVVIDIIECLTHRSNSVRQLADKFCELVVEYDRNLNGELGQLGLQIRKKRFESYNSGWLSATGATSDYAPVSDSYDDDSKFNDDMGWQGPGAQAKGIPIDPEDMIRSLSSNSGVASMSYYDRERYIASEAKYSRAFNDSTSEKGDESWGHSPDYGD